MRWLCQEKEKQVRLREYLINEKIDLSMPLNVTKNEWDMFETKFTVNNIKYRFLAVRDDEEDIWEVIFNIDKDMPTKKEVSGITGEIGIKAFELFSHLGSALVKFIKVKNPETFAFSSDQESRTKLYDRFAKMIAQKTKYKLSNEVFRGSKNFVFKRKKK